MGDARGARGNSEHADAPVVGSLGSRCRGRSGRFFGGLFLGGLFGELLSLLVVDELQEALDVRGGEQLVSPIDVHEHGHEAREHLEVHISIGRRGDHEQQGGVLAVRSLVVHSVGYGDGRQCGFLHGVGLCMGYGHPLPDSGCAARFAGKNRLAVCLDIAEVSGAIV